MLSPMISNKVKHCTNCGLSGHIFRNCNHPVTSYGVIAMRYLDNSIESSLFSKSPTNHSIQFLLIQRKDSLSYIEFIRGKYSATNDLYMSKLLRGMTQNEQERLVTYTFEQLWNDIWGNGPIMRSHKNEYDASEIRFLEIKDKLPELIKNNPTKWTEPEWGFPKGRRNTHEGDMECAIREFQEETDLKQNEFDIIKNTNTLSETFYGSNNVHYCHKYYLAICNYAVDVNMNIDNAHMLREIGNIKWFSFDEAVSKIRSDNYEKMDILVKTNNIMKQYYPIQIDYFRPKYNFK